MKVRATKMGFYGEGRKARRIKAGEIFSLLRTSDFSTRWMEWVEKPATDTIPEVKTTPGPEPQVIAPKPRGNPAWRKKEE